MKESKTDRGFDLIEFKDRYGVKCHLQKSSLATEDAIWFGCDKPNPRTLFKDKGWIEINNILNMDNILCDTCMHLTIDDVKKLLPYLQKFVDTGELI